MIKALVLRKPHAMQTPLRMTEPVKDYALDEVCMLSVYMYGPWIPELASGSACWVKRMCTSQV